MQLVLSLAAVLGALAIGVVSPGPSFLMVARTAVARSRADGVSAAIGMGVGGMLFCILALVGLTALIAAAPLAYLVFRIGGALYLVYLGWRIWRGSGVPFADDTTADAPKTSRYSAFARGFLTQISNPKTAVVWQRFRRAAAAASAHSSRIGVAGARVSPRDELVRDRRIDALSAGATHNVPARQADHRSCCWYGHDAAWAETIVRSNRESLEVVGTSDKRIKHGLIEKPRTHEINAAILISWLLNRSGVGVHTVVVNFLRSLILRHTSGALG